MRLIITLFLVALAIAFLSSLNQSLIGILGEDTTSKTEGDSSQEQPKDKKTLLESAGLASIVGAEKIDTRIISGPAEGETIEETNIVSFEFEELLSEENGKRVYFETKVEGLDSGWKKTVSNKVTVNFPAGHTDYTFLVRTIIGDLFDSTPAQRTFRVNNSPYFGKVKISGVSPPSPSRPSVITLRPYLNEGEEINITGWQAEGRMGKTTIPKEIDEYLLGLSSDNNIIIRKGEAVSLSSGRGPLGKNIGFRPNKCLGYLDTYNNHPLSLSGSCPKPKKEDISHLDPCCQEFILGISGCEVPDYSLGSKIYRNSDCIAWLKNNFNYYGCYRSYSGDGGFVSNNWYVYLSMDVATADFCDTIYLRDQNGLFVDKYSYGRDICRQ